jgi:hypothetical protein
MTDMSTPAWLSRMFGPIPDPNAPPPPVPVETIRRIRRIGLSRISDIGIWAEWMVVFEDEPGVIVNVSFSKRSGDTGMKHLHLAKPGDRLRMVHQGDNLIEVENLDF